MTTSEALEAAWREAAIALKEHAPDMGPIQRTALMQVVVAAAIPAYLSALSPDRDRMRSCPFCGDHLRHLDYPSGGTAWVHPGEDCVLGMQEIPDTPEAIAEWNRRAEPQSSGEGWMDIATAPKDGTEILVFTRTDEGAEMQQVASWDAHDPTGFPWAVSDGSSYHRELFTHWKPLPEGPASPKPAQGTRE